jgi:TolA-binding protein
MRLTSHQEWAWARRAAVTASAGLLLAGSVIGAASAQPYGAPPPSEFAPPPAEVRSADIRQDRIEELESQVREQTAENERLQFQLMQAERELTRLRAIVGDLAAANDSIVQGAAEDAAARAAPAQNANQNAAQQRATGTLGTVPAASVPAAPPEPPRDPAEDFRRAQQFLLNNRVGEAEAAFAEYLQHHPRGDDAADAQFWLSYTLLARNEFGGARDGFVNFLRANPNHIRAAEAQVRLGMALVGLGENRMACSAFRDLPGRSARAVRDLAAREARAANCPS